jgi:DNA polymerase-3 subunit delta
VPPIIYLFYGEDEFSISEAIRKMEMDDKVGGPAMASLNISRLDGRSLSLEEMRSAVSAPPFLGERRLVTVFNMLAKFDNNPEQQEKLFGLLDRIPATTGLVVVEHRRLPDKDDKNKKIATHWFLRWARGAGERVMVRPFEPLDGVHMQAFIQEQAKSAGGQITPRGAAKLSTLVSGDTRLATQEIHKLLAYTGYNHPVDRPDVEKLIESSGQVSIFALVDALAAQDNRQALQALRKLLEEEDPTQILGMIVRQFRLLLLGKEMLTNGSAKADLIRVLKIHPYVAEKIIAQSRRFSIAELETVYRRLLEVDEAIKTGVMEAEVALEIFAAGGRIANASFNSNSRTL